MSTLLKNWRKLIRPYISIFCIMVLFGVLTIPASGNTAQDLLNQEQEKMRQNEQRQQELQNELERLRLEEGSLANETAYLQSQIELTELEIEAQNNEYEVKEQEVAQLQKDITSLSAKLERIKSFISDLNFVLQNRIRAQYKKSQMGGELSIVFQGQDDIQDLMYRYQYLKTVQEQDKKLLSEMKSTKKDYDTQIKTLKTKKEEVEELKKQLAEQKKVLEAEYTLLEQQKSSKAYLLWITKNNEEVYQQMLNEIVQEQQALQAAVNNLLQQIGNPGNGVTVSKGEIIGIQGLSGMATGEHLHFGVYQYTEADFLNHNVNLCSNHLDPAPYLNSGELGLPIQAKFSQIPSLSEYNANDNYYADTWGISQVYGRTNFAQIPKYAASYCPYGFHNGLDIIGPIGGPIYASAEGIAYTVRLGDAQGNGVFIFHANGLMTLYWHLR